MSDARSRTAKATRDGILQWLTRMSGEHDVELVRGGMSVSIDRIPDMLDNRTGFWKDSGDFHKPPRWIFHVVASTEGPKAVFPSQPTFSAMGVISATSAKQRKGILTFRLFPVFKITDTRFEPHLGWEWLLWLAFPVTLSPALGNSAPVENLSFEAGEVFIRGQRHPFFAGGIVGLCDPEEAVTFDGFKEPVRYGEVSLSLHDLLKQIGSTAAPEVEFISTATTEVEST